MSQRDRQIVAKIIEYCDKIAQTLDRIGCDFNTYDQDYVYQYALDMCLMQIGELSGHCSDE